MGALRLTIQPAGGGAPSSVGFDQPQAILGRGSQCDIRLPFQIVSSHHLTFIKEKDIYQVIDVGSTNGTFLNEVRLIPNVSTPIYTGNMLRIVDLTIRIDIESMLCEGFTLAESTTMLRQMMSEALMPKDAKNRETALFEVVSGLRLGTRIILPDDLDEGWIGSSPESLVQISEPGFPARIGEIKRNGDGYAIELFEDHGRLIRVNGEPCQAFQPLRSGDRIFMGSMELVFYDPLEAHLAALDIQRPVSAPAKAFEPAKIPEQGGQNEAFSLAVVSNTVAAQHGLEEVSEESFQTEAPKRERLGPIELGLIALSGLLMLVGLVLFLYVFEII